MRPGDFVVQLKAKQHNLRPLPFTPQLDRAGRKHVGLQEELRRSQAKLVGAALAKGKFVECRQQVRRLGQHGYPDGELTAFRVSPVQQHGHQARHVGVLFEELACLPGHGPIAGPSGARRKTGPHAAEDVFRRPVADSKRPGSVSAADRLLQVLQVLSGEVECGVDLDRPVPILAGLLFPAQAHGRHGCQVIQKGVL